MTKKNDQSFWAPLFHEAVAAMSLGWDLAVPIFGGVLLGHFLDGWLGTRYVFTMGLLMLGVATGYYNVARFIRRVEARERQRVARKEDKASERG
jgi:F0F1-type ATP synthase assembly protein I